jgi:hypothetical protein
MLAGNCVLLLLLLPASVSFAISLSATALIHRSDSHSLVCSCFIRRVEGKIFYGHKIVLVTASPRLQSLLSSKVSEGNGTPTVQINDIRYHIFEVRSCCRCCSLR